MTIISDGAHVFIVSFGEISSSLSCERLTTVWAC